MYLYALMIYDMLYVGLSLELNFSRDQNCRKKNSPSPTFLIWHRALSQNFLIWKRALSRHLFWSCKISSSAKSEKGRVRMKQVDRQGLGGIIRAWMSVGVSVVVKKNS